MPKSKKPRKKGTHSREVRARQKWVLGKFKDTEDALRTYRTLERARLSRRKGCAQLNFLYCLSDFGNLLDAFAKAQYALTRWPTTRDYEDFNVVTSSLMLGALCHKRLDIVEQDLLRDIQHSAFMAVTCVRLRNQRKRIPEANIEAVRNGLNIAKQLMEFARDNDRQALIDVLKHNDIDNLAQTRGLQEAHERMILGDHFDTVRRWGLEDDSLEKAMKSGVLPEPEERYDYLEQRGGER